jgi:hypothetical protein
MKKSISELLKSCNELRGIEAKVNFLKANDNPVLRIILKCVFDSKIIFLLPEGTPPYKPSEHLDLEGRLYSEARRLYLFIEGGNPNLTKFKRESLFIQLIESLDKNDAELMVSVKDKKLPYKGVTEKVVREAFPDLISTEEKNEQVTKENQL